MIATLGETITRDSAPSASSFVAELIPGVMSTTERPCNSVEAQRPSAASNASVSCAGFHEVDESSRLRTGVDSAGDTRAEYPAFASRRKF